MKESIRLQLKVWQIELCCWKSQQIQSFYGWLARRLPRQIIYWAFIRAIVHATTGRWINDHIVGMEALTVLKRWGLKNK